MITMKLLTIKEVAALCKVSVRTIHRIIDDGGLPIIRVRHQIRIEEQELERYFSTLKNPGHLKAVRAA